MKKINSTKKEQIIGGIAATTVFSIISLVATGVGLISSVITGALNVVNATKNKSSHKKRENNHLDFNKSFDSMSYAKII